MNNYIPILIVMLLTVGPGIAQVLKKIQEKAKEDQSRRARLRQKDESLRTGRAPAQSGLSHPDGPRQDASNRLRQLEMERQARLKELRERAQRPASVSSSSARMTPAQAQQGARRGAPLAAPAQPGGRQAQAPARRPALVRGPSAPQRPVPIPIVLAPAPAPVRSRALTGVRSQFEAPRLASHAAPKPKTALTPQDSLRARLTDKHALREAIVLSELLQPPVSLREAAG